jgi:peptide/nickel transport system permease protein
MSAVPVAVPPLVHGPGFWRRALSHRSFAVGSVLSLLLAFAALLSLVWTPHSPYEIDMGLKLLPPDATYWFGTDAYGRDVASLLLVGARSSIVVGVIAVGIGLIVGTAFGLIASARRGWVEEIIMRLADFGFAFPAILSAIMLTAVFGPGMVNAIIAIGIYNIPTFARITRSAVLEVLREDFVRTARAKGVSRTGTLWGHVLRNAMIPVITIMGLQFAELLAGTIVVESVFYLPGLGRLIFQSISNRDLIVVRNCVMLLAAMVVIVNFFVDLLYAAIDPRVKASDI